MQVEPVAQRVAGLAWSDAGVRLGDPVERLVRPGGDLDAPGELARELRLQGPLRAVVRQPAANLGRRLAGSARHAGLAGQRALRQTFDPLQPRLQRLRSRRVEDLAEAFAQQVGAAQLGEVAKEAPEIAQAARFAAEPGPADLQEPAVLHQQLQELGDRQPFGLEETAGQQAPLQAALLGGHRAAQGVGDTFLRVPAVGRDDHPGEGRLLLREAAQGRFDGLTQGGIAVDGDGAQAQRRRQSPQHLEQPGQSLRWARLAAEALEILDVVEAAAQLGATDQQGLAFLAAPVGGKDAVDPQHLRTRRGGGRGPVPRRQRGQ